MLVLALALSILIGVSLGLLGGGGSILTTPILLYALGMAPKTAIATSLVVVGVTSLAGLIPHARAGNVDWKIGLLFGVAGMSGAYAGGWLAQWLPSAALMTAFVVMMLATSVAMFRGRRAPEGPTARRPTWQILALGVGVGAFAGLVGAGGGFLLVPALALFGGLEMRRAVGTSLLVIAMQSLAGYAGHAAHEHIDLRLAAMVSASAVVGSVLGGLLAGRVPPATLRRGFAAFVLVMAAFVLYRQVGAA